MYAKIICLTVFFVQFVWPMSVDVLGDEPAACQQASCGERSRRTNSRQ